VAGVEFRLVRAARLTGGPSALPGEKEIQESDETTSTNKQEARALDQLGAFIAHIIGYVRHGVQQSIQRQTDLNYFEACVVRGVLFRFPLHGFLFCKGILGSFQDDLILDRALNSVGWKSIMNLRRRFFT
jgi:hypothetical protein